MPARIDQESRISLAMLCSFVLSTPHTAMLGLWTVLVIGDMERNDLHAPCCANNPQTDRACWTVIYNALHLDYYNNGLNPAAAVRRLKEAEQG